MHELQDSPSNIFHLSQILKTQLEPCRLWAGLNLNLLNFDLQPQETELLRQQPWKKQLPTFDNDRSQRGSFPFHIEGRDAILSSIHEMTAGNETRGRESAALHLQNVFNSEH